MVISKTPRMAPAKLNQEARLEMAIRVAEDAEEEEVVAEDADEAGDAGVEEADGVNNNPQIDKTRQRALYYRKIANKNIKR